MSRHPWTGTGFLSLAVVLVGCAFLLAALDGALRALPSEGGVVPGGPPADGESPTRPVRDCELVRPFADERAVLDHVLRRPPRLGEVSPATGSSGGFSPTNVQVPGVDEPDLVKTDGRTLFIASGDSVIGLRADSATDARVLWRIAPGGRVIGLLVSGTTLVVISAGGPALPPGRWTLLSVHTLSGEAAPSPGTRVALGGSYVDARMAEGAVYLGALGSIAVEDERALLPSFLVDGVERTLSTADLRYLNGSEGSRELLLVLGWNLVRPRAPSLLGIVAPWGEAMYATRDLLYLSGRETWAPAGGSSAVHRFAVRGGLVSYTCSARVPGRILDQFSLDEYGGNLRVATYDAARRSSSVYILDEQLSEVGSLTGLGPGEFFYAARFLGDRGYLVTFKKVDPLFVIDLSDPRAPRVRGELKVPGFSNYLHPLPGEKLLGVGLDTVESEFGDFAWFQGVKVSLFDASDPAAPRELSAIRLGDRGSWTPVSYDHHAFLDLSERGLIALPVAVYEVDPAECGGECPPWTYGRPSWQGIVVLSLSPEAGLGLRARISHTDVGGTGMTVYRAVRVDDALFTVSLGMVQAHSLETFAPLALVPL